MGVGVSAPRRGDVYLVSLDPTQGQEIRKTRPCAIVSPDELNDFLRTFLVVPMTTGGHPYPFRIPCRFQEKNGFLVIDQLRTVDRRRLVGHLGRLTPTTLGAALSALQKMFTN
jgi:mRNA interferase MazF